MTSTLLSSHLQQISLCATSISELPFPGPKMFANALLASHDITALIRDTEVHERALFSIAPPPVPSKAQVQQFTNSVLRPSAAQGGSMARQPRRNTAVAAVLGGDLYRRVRNAGSSADSGASYGRARRMEKGDLDVDVLLEGAVKLCNVYPISGAADKIAKLRSRYQQLSANIAHYEDRVARNATQLDGMYHRQGHEAVPEDDETMLKFTTPGQAPRMTRQDLDREEEEILALESKKRGLEERVTGMEKDLGGLMR